MTIAERHCDLRKTTIGRRWYGRWERECMQISLPAYQLPGVGALQVVLPLSFTWVGGANGMSIMEQRQSERAWTIPTCENQRAAPRGIKPGSPWWEASRLTATPQRPQHLLKWGVAVLGTRPFGLRECVYTLTRSGTLFITCNTLNAVLKHCGTFYTHSFITPWGSRKGRAAAGSLLANWPRGPRNTIFYSNQWFMSNDSTNSPLPRRRLAKKGCERGLGKREKTGKGGLSQSLRTQYSLHRTNNCCEAGVSRLQRPGYVEIEYMKIHNLEKQTTNENLSSVRTVDILSNDNSCNAVWAPREEYFTTPGETFSLCHCKDRFLRSPERKSTQSIAALHVACIYRRSLEANQHADGLACLTTPLNIKPGRERNCNNSLRKSQVEKPPLPAGNRDEYAPCGFRKVESNRECTIDSCAQFFREQRIACVELGMLNRDMGRRVPTKILYEACRGGEVQFPDEWPLGQGPSTGETSIEGPFRRNTHRERERERERERKQPSEFKCSSANLRTRSCKPHCRSYTTRPQQCEPGSIPGEVAPRFPQVGIVPDDAAGSYGFSRGSPIPPRSCIPALLHSHLVILIKMLLNSYSILGQIIFSHWPLRHSATTHVFDLAKRNEGTTIHKFTLGSESCRDCRMIGGFVARTRITSPPLTSLTGSRCELDKKGQGSEKLCRRWFPSGYSNGQGAYLSSGLPLVETCEFRDKIDAKHVYTKVDFAIGSQFIRHALDDSEPIADVQGNKLDSTPLCTCRPRISVQWPPPKFGKRVRRVLLFNPAMRVIEVSMEQCRNERARKTGYPRENPPTNGIVRHDSHMRKSGLTHAGN
ncbi:hypothetical protein PR048_033606 [Dryococelus australis]|uniref:Uncharacterized protein n=1 Tax=Dryococelus australis TaxID=614101 RepID=A0ABQ9G3T0_9NEOP|nr:hypothetical protein PR048_033606 [Dryococelus australis]